MVGWSAAAQPSAATPASQPSASAPALFDDKVLAKGRGFEIKQSQVDEMYYAFKANRSARGESVPDSLRPKIEADMLDRLIATQVCLQKATEPDRAKARELADKFVQDQIKQAPSERSFYRQLRALGMTPEQFKTQILEQAIVKEVLDRELKNKTTVTIDQMRRFYEDNPVYFQDPELVRVGHILFSNRDSSNRPLSEEQLLEKKKTAEKVLTRARAGEDFTHLARQFSEDTAVKENKGEYTIARAKDDPRRSMPPEFEAAAFTLNPGQISDLVTTRHGFHILKKHETIPPRKTEFDQVQDRIKETLLQEAVQKQLPEFIAKLRAEAGVVILSDYMDAPN